MIELLKSLLYAEIGPDLILLKIKWPLMTAAILWHLWIYSRAVKSFKGKE
jgi:hypothetical protein